jgi:hypothetical protein
MGMNTYRITNPTTGADLGTYTGTTPAQALDAMAREAGYRDYAACCEDVPAPDGGLRVTETEEWCPAAQGYRRTAGGSLAWVAPGLGNKWAWSVRDSNGHLVGQSTAASITGAKERADAAIMR